MQFNIINGFIYINLDKTVFIYMSTKYSKNSKVLYLIKALYGL